MYALKLITEREGRKVEAVHRLGDMYRLDFYSESENKDIVARVEHSKTLFHHLILNV